MLAQLLVRAYNHSYTSSRLSRAIPTGRSSRSFLDSHTTRAEVRPTLCARNGRTRVTIPGDNPSPVPPVAVVVSTRPYGAIDLLSLLVQNRFTSAERGPSDALAFIHHLRPQLVVAVMNPARFSDLDLLRSIARSTAAVILVLAPNGESRAAALRAGADLVLQDSDGREALEAQVAAIRRRLLSDADLDGREGTLVLGPLSVNLGARRASVGDVNLPLTNMEFSLLAALASNAGRVLSPMEVARLATGRLMEEPEASQTIKVYVRRLRQKLQAAGLSGDLIVNVRGRGYMWDVTPASKPGVATG